MKWGNMVLVLWTLIVLGVLLSPIGESEVPAPWGFRHWDKVYHAVLFAITGFVAVYGARFLSRFGTRMLFGIVFGLTLAVTTEFAQSLIPHRSMSLYDLLADVLGLGAAVIFYALLYRQSGLRRFFRM